MKKNLLRNGIIIGIFSLSAIFTSCAYHNVNASDKLLPNSVSVAESYVIEDSKAINQYNNIHLTGFALMINDTIFFADNRGIHKTDTLFETVDTLVLNENYLDCQKSGMPMFTSLQYHNGKIYFLNRGNETNSFASSIYAMTPEGDELTKILDTSILDTSEKEGYKKGIITEFIVFNEKIYFNYFSSGAILKSFDMETKEIENFNIIDTPVLTLSPDNSALQFSRDLTIPTHLNFENSEINSVLPSNFGELFDNNYLASITYTTVSDGKIVFSSPSMLGSRIFIMNEDGYAEVIYHNEDDHIDSYLNAIGDWIYFTSTPEYFSSMSEYFLWIPENDLNTHLYRIKNDGSDLELVYENIGNVEEGLPSIFINLFSEDIILFKTHPEEHTIYALIRDIDTNEFIIKVINPSSDIVIDVNL